MKRQSTKDKSKPKLHRAKSLYTYHWYSGLRSRDEATDLLKDGPNGAFLIRESESGGLAISIHNNDRCFHIKIMEKNGKVFLTDKKLLTSVDELITFYSENSLENSFESLPTKLTQLMRKPFKGEVVAIYDWDAQTGNELSFKAGDVISVLEDEANWWVGEMDDGQRGYFPRNYVQ